MLFNFKSKLWLYEGSGAWIFATLPRNTAKEVRQVTNNLPKRGFGSVKVVARVNDIYWKTSVFPDTKSKSYLLPIKKEIRKQASISVGDTCNFTIEIKDI